MTVSEFRKRAEDLMFNLMGGRFDVRTRAEYDALVEEFLMEHKQYSEYDLNLLQSIVGISKTF